MRRLSKTAEWSLQDWTHLSQTVSLLIQDTLVINVIGTLTAAVLVKNTANSMALLPNPCPIPFPQNSFAPMRFLLDTGPASHYRPIVIGAIPPHAN